MNQIIHKFLLTGFKFVTELHLKHPGYTYSACWQFTKHSKKIEKFREAGNLKKLYRNELDKDCFAHDAAYSNSKYLAKRTISDKIWKDGAYETARNRGYDGYQRELASIVYKVFHKKTGSGISINEELTIGLNKPVIKNFERFKNNILAADLAET